MVSGGDDVGGEETISSLRSHQIGSLSSKVIQGTSEIGPPRFHSKYCCSFEVSNHESKGAENKVFSGIGCVTNEYQILRSLDDHQVIFAGRRPRYCPLRTNKTIFVKSLKTI